jgi:hypothetical protein
MATRFFYLAFLISAAFAANAQVNIPPDYPVIKGLWIAQGNSGTVELSVDSLEAPTKGYLTKNGGSCFSVKKRSYP